MEKVAHCLICEKEQFVAMPYFHLYNGEHIQMVRCRQCGLVMLDKRPSLAELKELYSEEYFQKDYRCGCLAQEYTKSIEEIQHEFKPQLKKIRRFAPQGKFLEIGCAGGATLAVAKAYGYNEYGVEFSESMAQWGRQHLGVRIFSGMLEQQQFAENFFDVVYMGDVIEHIVNPLELLLEVKRVLKPSGIVAIAYPCETNNFTAVGRQLLHRTLQVNTKPYHLYCFTPKTITLLLQKDGFNVLVSDNQKLLVQQNILKYAVNLANYVVTSLFNRFGDRGYVITRKSSA